MKAKLDAVLKALALICLLVFAIAAAGQGIAGNTAAAYAYLCAAAWAVIYLVMEESEGP